jgi:cyanophycinase-like exopeptidase
VTEPGSADGTTAGGSATGTTLVLMGSGETAPTMVTVHRQVLEHVPRDADALLLDTPYGFQVNAGDISSRAVAYFARHVGRQVSVAEARRAELLDAVAAEALRGRVRHAGWVFAGPGSPTYLVRQWQELRLAEALRDRLRPGGSTRASVFASAAACTIGRLVVPVYEIYKSGEDPHWREGLDLTAELGLDVVVVPHFDNTEGGTHDTRYCYLGEQRLRALEATLPSSTWVLGIDEHTAAIVDADRGTVAVEGRGAVTVRARELVARLPAGSTTTIEALLEVASGPVDSAPLGDAPADAGTAAQPVADLARNGPPVTADPFADALDGLVARFDAAVADGDAMRAAAATLEVEELLASWAADTLQSAAGDRARAELHRQVVTLAGLAQAGLHEHRELVAPHVEQLLAMRGRARADGRFDDADAIRAALVDGGVEVRDTAEGSSWVYRDPTLEALRNARARAGSV